MTSFSNKSRPAAFGLTRTCRSSAGSRARRSEPRDSSFLRIGVSVLTLGTVFTQVADGLVVFFAQGHQSDVLGIRRPPRVQDRPPGWAKGEIGRINRQTQIVRQLSRLVWVGFAVVKGRNTAMTEISAVALFKPPAASRRREPLRHRLGALQRVTLRGVDRAVSEELRHAAHGTCPYSKVTRGNIEVTTTLL